MPQKCLKLGLLYQNYIYSNFILKSSGRLVHPIVTDLLSDSTMVKGGETTKRYGFFYLYAPRALKLKNPHFRIISQKCMTTK